MATAPNAAARIPAVGYARRSTDMQDRSIPDQKAYVEKWAAEHGYAIIRWFVDDAISGTSTRGRDAFSRLIAEAEAGADFGTVVVYDISRFSRGGTNETGFFLHRLRLAKVEVVFVDSEVVQQFGPTDDLKKADAVLIPGGFGSRGIEGKIMTANYARTEKVPFLGVCLGFQIATIEFARNVLGMADANSTEFDPRTSHPVVDLLPEQKNVTKMGATMRLGAQPVVVREGSRAFKLYGSALIMERHRHRYEVNPKYIEDFEREGWHFTGRSADGVKMEIGELESHPFYVASQFHPEFKSRPNRPSPLHLGLVKAAVKRRYG